jgi:hypothetical protein
VTGRCQSRCGWSPALIEGHRAKLVAGFLESIFIDQATLNGTRPNSPSGDKPARPCLSLVLFCLDSEYAALANLCQLSDQPGDHDRNLNLGAVLIEKGIRVRVRCISRTRSLGSSTTGMWVQVLLQVLLQVPKSESLTFHATVTERYLGTRERMSLRCGVTVCQ